MPLSMIMWCASTKDGHHRNTFSTLEDQLNSWARTRTEGAGREERVADHDPECKFGRRRWAEAQKGDEVRCRVFAWWEIHEQPLCGKTPALLRSSSSCLQRAPSRACTLGLVSTGNIQEFFVIGPRMSEMKKIYEIKVSMLKHRGDGEVLAHNTVADARWPHVGMGGFHEAKPRYLIGAGGST